MVYKRIPEYSMGTLGNDDFYGIPLPNEKEDLTRTGAVKRKVPMLSTAFDYIRRRIRIEEIILVGLIILMLDESIEDDLLLVILIYILLF